MATFRAIIGVFVAGFVCAPLSAYAACPSRIGIEYGDTLGSIARACGISVETLRQANPGLSPVNLQAGTFIAVPRPALPSRQITIGQPTVPIMPPLVPPSVGGNSPTVILPPQPAPIPQQHILRGFGDQPGQLPLPPGHAPQIPGFPPPLF
ncbi:LysM domain-containing protein [Mesorhizobium sp. CAU 1732]|uniref:LysM peptidoglycan-binding domain-containing protein n=1 Tax=Mesorhizobium sp. CAU 1732 TaxID=3140358 RepID=UPI003260DAD4